MRWPSIELRCLLHREWLELRRNRMLWPVFVILPLIGAAIPGLMAAGSAELLGGGVKVDPALQTMVDSVRWLAAATGLRIEEAAATLLLRISAGYFLLMPLALVSVAGAYAIVGEKLQKTLEPVLATPVATTTFLQAKLLAVLLPAVLVSWLAAVLGAAISVLSFWISHSLLVWPDGYYWAGVVLLGPQIGAIATLLCLRISQRVQDAQTANQITALILIPALLLLFGLAGPLLISHWLPVLLAAVLNSIAIALLLRWLRRSFEREHILVRWR